MTREGRKEENRKEKGRKEEGREEKGREEENRKEDGWERQEREKTDRDKAKGNKQKSRRQKAVKQKGIKPTLALWALLAESSIYKILTVLAVTAAAEVLLFRGGIKAAGDTLTEYRSLTAAVEGSHISLVFLAALGLIYFILVWTEGRLSSQSSGTMLRLKLSGSRIFWSKAVYNLACLVLLFAVQAWLCIWLIRGYGRAAEGGDASPLSLFLAFYRIDFLHCLLPMAEAGKWVRNVLLLSAFAVEAAAAETGKGKGEKTEYVPAILLYTLTTGWFAAPLGGTVLDWLSMILYLFVISLNIWHVYKAEGERVQACD